ncbi:MAG: CoA transferase [Chitinophagales bacterium]|nr:CoA transferase [Chitinophagales bacterium]
MDEKIFSGLKIVELASVLAGPLVGSFFSELGAKVIKIENKLSGGDVTRGWKLAEESSDSPVSAYYSSANYNKTILKLNLNDRSDRETAHAHIEDADIVVANFRAEKAEAFQMDFNSLKKIKTDIIYGLITGYGVDDVRTAYDVVLQAESGYMSMNGTPSSGPVKLPVAFMDVLTAHQLKEGLLCALYKRSETGKGSLVHVSLYDTAISSLTNQASNYLMTGRIAQRMGTLHPNLAPYGEVFCSSDNVFFVLAIGSDSQFNSLTNVLDIPDLAADKRYGTNRERVIHRKELFSVLKDAFNVFNMLEISQNLQVNNIPFGIIRTIDQVFQDPSAQSLILDEILEDQPTKRVRTAVFKISDN